MRVGGRYRCLHPLARGGMSRIFLAEDEHLGRKVALKFFDGARFREGEDTQVARRRFQREARLAASLRHPNIVEVLDAGEHDGVPFMALGLIEGSTLGQLIREHKLPPVEDGVRAMIEVAQALEFAHGRDILHRDLKPDNIMVDGDGHCRLLDFGLAKLLDETRDTRSGMAAGTPSHIAPERLMGEDATAMSDVFSAGIVFFEYLTGRYPFSLASLFYSLIYEEAPAPSHLRPELPAPLEAVLLRMLAKRPADRYQSFTEVRSDLDRVLEDLRSPRPRIGEDEGFLGWKGMAQRTQMALPLVGRRREVGRIGEVLAQVGAGTGASLGICAPAGLGKTRLVEEAIRHARLRQFATYVGRAVDTLGAHPYQPLLGLARHWMEQQRLKTLADLERHAAEHAPRLTGVLPVLGGLLSLGPAAPRERDQLFEAFALLLDSLAGERPALVALEDLHAADPATLALLRFLHLGQARRRLLLLVTFRPEGPLGERLQAALADDEIEVLTPALLPDEAVGEMVTGVLVDEADEPRLVPYVVRECQGSPLFVTELLKLLKAQEVLVPCGHGYRLSREPSAGAIPDGMREVIGRRLDRLTPAEREVAEVAAVLGESFAPRDLAALTRGGHLAVLRVLQELERRHHFVVAAGRGYRFVHDRVREVLYQAISPPLRAEYHGLIAEALAQPGRAGDAAVVARHFELAERVAEAASWHKQAAAQARRAFALEAAARHLDRARELQPDAFGVDDLVALGQTWLDLGSLEAGERCYGAVRAMDEVRGLLGLAKVAELRSDWKTVEECCTAGLDRLPADGADELRADLLRRRGVGYQRRGELAAARVDLETSVGIARSAGASRALCEGLRVVAACYRLSADLPRAEEAIAEAVRMADELGDPVQSFRCLINRGTIEAARGWPGRALATQELALAAARTSGGPALQATALVNLARTALHLGHLPRSAEEARRALATMRGVGNLRLEMVATVNLCAACCEMGLLAEATAALERACLLEGHADAAAREHLVLEHAALDGECGRIDEALGALERLAASADRQNRALARMTRGAITLVSEPRAAVADLREASELLARAGPAWVRPKCQALLAQALVALGDLGEAEAVLAGARAETVETLCARRELARSTGLLALATGQHDRAAAALGEAVDTARAQQARIRLAELLIALDGCSRGEAALASGDSPRAAAVQVLCEVATELPVAQRRVFLSNPRFSSAGAEAWRRLDGGRQ